MNVFHSSTLPEGKIEASTDVREGKIDASTVVREGKIDAGTDVRDGRQREFSKMSNSYTNIKNT